MIRVLSLALTASLLAVVAAKADVAVLTATDAGFVTIAGGSAKGDGTISPATYNYSAGRELHYSDGALGSPLAPMDRKNYFVFDLSGVTGPIVAASLSLYAGPDVGPPFPMGMHGYESVDPVETYGLAPTGDHAGALADIGALKFANTVGPSEFDDPSDPAVGMAAALYAKLADAPLPLAFIVLSPADDGTIVSLTFTVPGIGYLNSHLGGLVVLGGLVPTAMPPATPQSVFGFTGPDLPGGDPLSPKLTVTYVVPEASAASMVALTGLLIAGCRWGWGRLAKPSTDVRV